VDCTLYVKPKTATNIPHLGLAYFARLLLCRVLKRKKGKNAGSVVLPRTLLAWISLSISSLSLGPTTP
jgi:hypothetical protein